MWLHAWSIILGHELHGRGLRLRLTGRLHMRLKRVWTLNGLKLAGECMIWPCHALVGARIWGMLGWRRGRGPMQMLASEGRKGLLLKACCWLGRIACKLFLGIKCDNNLSNNLGTLAVWEDQGRCCMRWVEGECKIMVAARHGNVAIYTQVYLYMRTQWPMAGACGLQQVQDE